jgi:hypothetical protein
LADIGLEDSNNTTGFLFGDEDSNSAETRTTPTAQPGNTDAFPSLFRQQAYPTMVSLPLFLFSCRQAVRLFGTCFAFPSSLETRFSKVSVSAILHLSEPLVWQDSAPNFCF